MGSTFILKVRTSLKSSQLFFQHGRPAFSTLQPPWVLSVCSREPSLTLGVRRTHRSSSGQTKGQGGVRNSTIRSGEEDGTVNGGGDKRSAPRQRIHKSVFAAGTAKRTADILRRRAPLVCEYKDEEEPERRSDRGAGRLQPPERPLPSNEWKKLKESQGNPPRFEIQMMKALFTSGGELDVAKSLLTFVATETGTLSYELLLRYLTLCVSSGHDAEVFDVYDIMRGSFPSLDTGASSLFIKAFSRTARWREALNILQELKKTFSPSPRNYGDVIAAAMQHGDTSTAWALYDELIDNGLSPHQETWETLFKVAGKKEGEEGTSAMSQAEQQERHLGILLHMRNNQIYPQQSLASSIKSWFNSLTGQEWTGNWTTATPKGVCRSCGSELESIQLTAEEYQQLKDRVMTDIIEGQDVFTKTTPEELQRFKLFVKRKPAFDVVVDGLNVANSNKDKSKQSETLLLVVSELVDRQGLTVLVLGRKHMLRPSRSWDRHNMNLIQQKAHCFFTDNISEDDPFLLYATLHSGNHCRFVSRDLMRDHKACLPDGATKRLFFKWQRGHQLVVDGHVTAGRRVRFQSIPSYDTIVQTSGGNSWHIPYDETEDRSTYEVPQHWLCLNKKL
ncbi:mitochondrial ribonuclease P catalytic subunit [Simochromis diagramma]|uniref:mitochondrial ribonuclease P catalytic subunit n=1 Tax=Simochromis diagramma TaxID=43689 RepID=UPI001A7E83A6|nr:mitochondrial ribonuclease P catalytic subunit [Simochromis diagramma]